MQLLWKKEETLELLPVSITHQGGDTTNWKRREQQDNTEEQFALYSQAPGLDLSINYHRA